jgi:hypothetical protein
MTAKEIRTLRLLRIIALLVALSGAGGSLGFVVHAGRNNKSVLLIVFFIIWVLSPFVALLIANTISMRWTVHIRKTLYGLTIFLTLGSLIFYSGLWSPPGTRPAFVFLVVPLLSWILMAIAASRARRLSRKPDAAQKRKSLL